MGSTEAIEDEIVRQSGAQYYTSIQYEAPDEGSVRLYVGASAKSGAWFHVPVVCMPAAGWAARKLERVAVENVPGRSDGLPVWRLELAKGTDQMLVYYWFHMGDRVVASPFERARLRFQDLLHGRMEQPVQIVILYAPVVGGMKATEERVQTLARLLWPHLSSILVSGD